MAQRIGPGRLRAHRLVVAIAVIVFAGCGSGAAEDDAAGSPEEAASEFVGISAVQAADATTLEVLTDPLPTATSGRCAVTVRPRLVETEGEVTVYADLLSGPRPPFTGCDVSPRAVQLRLGAPVGARRVTDAFGSIFWMRDGEWSGCDHVVMTCESEPAACDNGSLRAAISNADVPRRFGMSNTRCESRFAVVDVDYGAGACPAGDSAPNRCVGQRVRRQFWRVENERWVLIAAGTRAGCEDVMAAEPQFPSSLCEDLPPV